MRLSIHPRTFGLTTLMLGSVVTFSAPMSGCGDDAATGAGGTGGAGGASSTTAAVGGSGGDGAGGSITNGPAPPIDLAAAVEMTPFDVVIGWNPGADGRSISYVTAVAPRAADLDAVQLSDGEVYLSGDQVADGVVVIASGDATEARFPGVAVDATTQIGVWAIDAQGRYSQAARTSVTPALPEQSFTVDLDVDAKTATVTQGATHATLTAQIEEEGVNVRLHLSLTNRSSRAWFNPKLVIASKSGNFNFVGDGQSRSGDPATYLGPRPLGPGQSHTTSFQVQSGAMSKVTVGVVAENNRGFMSTPNRSGLCMLDLSGATYADGTAFGGLLDFDGMSKPYVDSNGRYRIKGTHFSDDGTQMVVGRNRSAPWLVRVDLTNGTVLAGPPLAPSLGYMSAPILAADGSAFYLSLVTGQRFASTDLIGRVAVVGVDPQTLAETSRVEVAETNVKTAEIALSPDGNLAAVPLTIRQQIALVDLTTMTVLDTDPSTPGDQHVDVGMGVVQVRFSPDSTAVYGVRKAVGDATALVAVDTTTFAVTALRTSPASNIGGKHGALGVGNDGRIWVGRTGSGDLLLRDPTATGPDVLVGGLNVRGIAFDETHAYVHGRAAGVASVYAYDQVTLVPLDFDNDQNNGPTALRQGTTCRPAHHAFLTPF